MILLQTEIFGSLMELLGLLNMLDMCNMHIMVIIWSLEQVVQKAKARTGKQIKQNELGCV